MKNSRDFHSIPRRITAVTAVRSKVNRQVLGWLFKCYSCYSEEVFMVSQYDKTVALTQSHVCKWGKGNGSHKTSRLRTV